MGIARTFCVLPLVLLVSCSAPDVTAPDANDHVRGLADAKVTWLELIARVIQPFMLTKLTRALGEIEDFPGTGLKQLRAWRSQWQ